MSQVTSISTIKNWKAPLSIFLVWLFVVSGIIGIWLGHGDWFLPLTPLNLLVGSGLLIWNFPKINWKNTGIWAATFAIGMFVEILGVNYGLLFGDYYYGENFGPKILGVPLLIGLNWAVLTFLSAYLSQRWLGKNWLAYILGAALMVGLDFFIEPTAPLFDFWHWDIGHAPLQNFVAWFGVALVLQVIVRNFIPSEKHPLPLHHFLSQVAFFAFFYVLYHL